MTFINPQPETPDPIIKPREGETLRSWLTRKNHALMFHSWYPYLHFNDRDLGTIMPGRGYHTKLVDYWQEEINKC